MMDEKIKKNLKIIEDVNKRFGGLSHDIKRDTGFGRYHPMKEGATSKVNFFMTNVDEEQKRKKM